MGCRRWIALSAVFTRQPITWEVDFWTGRYQIFSLRLAPSFAKLSEFGDFTANATT